MTVLRRDFDFVRELVLSRTSIVLDERQAYLAESRLLPVAKRLGFADLASLVERGRMKPDGPEAQALVEAMTTNETSFFRDIHPFESLRNQVIPTLIKSRQSERHLNIWCAASSTGQEPYSVAMLLRDHFPMLAGWKVQILATDVATSILERAREGIFNQVEISRGLSPSLMTRHFERIGTSWRARDYLRNAIVWRQMNLVNPWKGLPSFDVVLIRNVLIYFSIEMRRLIVNRLAHQIRNDSLVFLGAAESLIGVTNTLTSVSVGKAIAYQLSR